MLLGATSGEHIGSFFPAIYILLGLKNSKIQKFGSKMTNSRKIGVLSKFIFGIKHCGN